MRPRPEDRGEPLAGGDSLSCLRSFNAATARRPWRTRFQLSLLRAQLLASMRPRPEDRGELSSGWSSPCPRRRFNAATARRPWRTYHKEAVVTLGKELQCGHGPKTVENSSLAAVGNTADTLQCGHGPKTVENRSVGEPQTAQGTWLQCGHGPKTVENAVSGSGFPRERGASMRPRPEDRGEPSPKRAQPPGPIGLQCGHGPKTVENACAEARLEKPMRASMRPRPEDRGEREMRRVRLSPRQGFNAATARRPWRTEDGRGPKSARKHCFNAATARRPWRTRRSSLREVERQGASMRPRPEDRGEPQRCRPVSL